MFKQLPERWSNVAPTEGYCVYARLSDVRVGLGDLAARFAPEKIGEVRWVSRVLHYTFPIVIEL